MIILIAIIPIKIIIMIIVIVITFPFFQVTSAYEYLEKRFDKSVRWLGSIVFIIQVRRRRRRRDESHITT